MRRVDGFRADARRSVAIRAGFPPVLLRGLSEEEAGRALFERLSGPRGFTPGAKPSVALVKRRPPVVYVTGRVMRTTRSESEVIPRLDALLEQSSLLPDADRSGIYVWREVDGGFARVSKADAEADGLRDLDIVVVP